jgi:hypothetical protein
MLLLLPAPGQIAGFIKKRLLSYVSLNVHSLVIIIALQGVQLFGCTHKRVCQPLFERTL